MTPQVPPLAQMIIRLFPPAAPGQPNQVEAAGPFDNPAAFVAVMMAACQSFLSHQEKAEKAAMARTDGIEIATEAQVNALARLKQQFDKPNGG